MNELKKSLRQSFFAGLLVLLPGVILWAVLYWVFQHLQGWLLPIAKSLQTEGTGDFVAFLMALALVICVCLLVGYFVTWRIGRYLYELIEQRLLSVAPGYNLIKETLQQFLGNRESPFASVALVRIFENDTMVTAFVTERHANGWCSVFVPTGPNPTSGAIYHVKPELVHHVNLPVEDVMRSIISCGAGSGPLIRALQTAAPDLPCWKKT